MAGRAHRGALAALVSATAVLALAAAPAGAQETIAPASHDFGSKTLQSSAAHGFTLSVPSDSFVPMVGVSGDFSQTNDCPLLMGTLGTTTTCTITVRFTPTASGSRTGTLTTGEAGPTAALIGRGTASLVIDTPVGKVTCAKGKKKKKGVRPCKRKKRAKAKGKKKKK